MAARIDWVEQRLVRWALAVTQGLDGSGYPSMNVLHRAWSPPTSGQTPTLKVAASSDDVMGTHRALEQLSMRARNTVAVHYCMRLPLAEQAQRLECAVATVHQRVVAAHRDLARILGES